MNQSRSLDRLIVNISVTLFCISLLLKFPGIVGLAFYSDLVSWYYDTVVISMNAVMARFVAYPALAVAHDPQTYVLVTGAILLVTVALSVHILLKLLQMFGLERWRAFLFALSPSFIFFAYYNIDVVGILFILGALYFALKRKWTFSACILGFAIATKVFPFIYIPLVWLVQPGWKERVKYASVTLLVWLALNLPFIIANFSDWYLFVSVQGQWGIEDSWMIFVLPQMSPIAHYLSYLLLILGIVHVVRQKMPLERAWFAATLVFMLSSFKFPPQYFLYVLPFVVILGFNRLEPFLLADVLNVLVIVTWFTPWLNGGNPLDASSPTQWIGLARELILFAVLVYLVQPHILKWSLQPLSSENAV